MTGLFGFDVLGLDEAEVVDGGAEGVVCDGHAAFFRLGWQSGQGVSTKWPVGVSTSRVRVISSQSRWPHHWGFSAAGGGEVRAAAGVDAGYSSQIVSSRLANLTGSLGFQRLAAMDTSASTPRVLMSSWMAIH